MDVESDGPEEKEGASGKTPEQQKQLQVQKQLKKQQAAAQARTIQELQKKHPQELQGTGSTMDKDGEGKPNATKDKAGAARKERTQGAGKEGKGGTAVQMKKYVTPTGGEN